MVIVNFPSEMIEIASCYDECVNKDSLGLTHTLNKEEIWIEIEKLTTKELQSILKVALSRISNPEFNVRLRTESYNKDNILKFRKQCKNVKLRHIYLRLISKEYFTMEKMFKYKMVDNNKCKRCGEVETYMHLLWECREARRIWAAFNEFRDFNAPIIQTDQQYDKVQKYEDIFKIGNIGNVSKTKLKIIQGMIQLERPSNWSIDNIKKIASEIKNIEIYNTKIFK